MKYKNLILIGTSHIAKQSIKEVEQAIEKYSPEVVCIELDKGRLLAMFAKKTRLRLSDIFKVGLKGYLFALLGAWAEKKLGKIVGVKPGSDMLMAYKTARKHNIQVALIDQEISITLKRFSKEITWKEKFRFIGEIFKSFFKKKKIPFDLRKVPSEKIIKEMIEDVKKKYPNAYKVLIKERNEFMAKKLSRIIIEHKGIILGIIGAGHEKEIIELIKKELEKLVTPTYSFTIN